MKHYVWHGLFGVLLLLGLLWVHGAQSGVVPEPPMTPVPITVPVTENERQSLVVGLAMGIDLAGAQQGLPPLSRSQWLNFIEIFDALTRGCTTTTCITDRVVTTRTNLMNQSKSHRPLGPLPQVEKELH
jgi:hypothetical protein